MKGILWIDNLSSVGALARLEVPAHRHITLHFGAEKEQYENLIGKQVEFTVESEYCSDRIQAVKVTLPDWVPFAGTIPHCTISHIAEAKPVESSDMILSGEAILCCDVGVVATGTISFLEWT